MFIPDYVNHCIQRLEAAGFAAYAVGGCVRDHLLGRTPLDYDLCTSATPEQMQQIFADHRLVLAGEKHGTVTVICEDKPIEITTFRTEGGYADHRHPDWVRYETTIEADLSRRDFTVNAMAYSPTRGLADPFGGQADLQKGILRAVGQPQKRFTEDALRILRGVRFAVRFSLTPEEETLQTMFQLAPLMDNLARERVFSELCKLLPLIDAAQLQLYAPILTQVIAELAPMVGFDQCSPHHAYDVYTHTALVVEKTPPELALRWAALLHDVGKCAVFYKDEDGRGHFPEHAKVGSEIADKVLLRLKAPTALRQQVVELVQLHMLPIGPDKRLLRRRIHQLGFDRLNQLLVLMQADSASKGVPSESAGEFKQIRTLLEQIKAEEGCLSLKDLAINGHDLMSLGLSGKQVGSCLNYLLQQILDENLVNDKTALLNAAAVYKNEEICQ